MAALTRVLQEQDFASEEEANEFLQNLLASGALPEHTPETPLEQAQELVFQAIEAKGKRRAELARHDANAERTAGLLWHGRSKRGRGVCYGGRRSMARVS